MFSAMGCTREAPAGGRGCGMAGGWLCEGWVESLCLGVCGGIC